MSANTERPENPALLAAIIAQPDEDTPRLMYADWLQENGDPDRAEFIRLHIEWDRRPFDAPPDGDLKRRLVAAWEVLGRKDDWRFLCPEWTHCAYERGFRAVAEFDFRGDEFLEIAESTFASAPIRMLYTQPSEYDFSAQEPNHLERFLALARSTNSVTGFGTELEHNSGLRECWTEYLKLPQTSALRVLDIGYSRGMESCPLVAGLTNLTNLLVLDMTVCCRLDDWCLEQLTTAAHLQSLLALRLAADDDYLGAISADGIAALAKSPHLTNLRQLTLNNHEDLNDAAINQLLNWEYVGQLEVLELSCRSITDTGVVALARSRKLHNLRRLVLDGARLDPAAITSVLDSTSLQGLAEFYLSPAPASLPIDLQQRLGARFPSYATMLFDPPAVCIGDRIRARYRLMMHPSGGGTYRGRDEAYSGDNGGHDRAPVHPEYAIL